LNKIKKILSDLLFKIFLAIFQQKPNNQKIHFYYPAKILIIGFGDIQHALVTTPLLQVIKNNYNAFLSVLGHKENIVVFNPNTFIINAILCEDGIISLFKQIIKLNREKFDLIIDTHETLSRRASIIIGILNAKYKIGFIKGNEKLLSHKLPLLNPNKTHIVDRLLHLTKPLEMDYTVADLNILYQTSSKSKEIIQEYSIKNDLIYKFTALINLSNNYKLGFWGVDNYKKLMKYLNNYNINIIVTASLEDIEIAEKVNDKNQQIFYNTDFDIYAELVNHSNFVFSPDSFTVQLAAAYKIPIFCLFVQQKTAEMINIPYNSDFEFALTEKDNLKHISYGKVLNGLVPYFEYVYETYQQKRNT